MLTESTVAICVTVTLTSLLWTPPLTPSSQLVHSAQFVFPLCLGNRVVALEDNFLCGNASKAARWSFCGYTATMSSMPLNIHIHCEQEIERAFFFLLSLNTISQLNPCSFVYDLKENGVAETRNPYMRVMCLKEVAFTNGIQASKCSWLAQLT